MAVPHKRGVRVAHDFKDVDGRPFRREWIGCPSRDGSNSNDPA
jgi:hypothetical protein